jgi:hypothetical protein
VRCAYSSGVLCCLISFSVFFSFLIVETRELAIRCVGACVCATVTRHGDGDPQAAAEYRADSPVPRVLGGPLNMWWTVWAGGRPTAKMTLPRITSSWKGGMASACPLEQIGRTNTTS